MRVYDVPLVLNQTTMNANLVSTPIQLYQMFGYAIQLVWTGTPTGTFKLQASADPVPQGPPASASTMPTHWSDIANSNQAVSAAGTYMWNIPDAMYNYVRLVYTDTSGGLSTAVITVKIFNGKGM